LFTNQTYFHHIAFHCFSIKHFLFFLHSFNIYLLIIIIYDKLCTRYGFINKAELFHSLFYSYFGILEAIFIYLFIYLFIYIFGGTGVWAQGFVIAKQTPYHLSHASNLLCLGYFGDVGCLSNYLSVLVSNHSPPDLILTSS
jgi:hypothetical protein